MATYIGFNTQNLYQTRTQQGVGEGSGTGNLTVGYYQQKKYKLTDAQLVIQDVVNSLAIKQGDLVGNPAYGTTLWSYVFEPSTPDIHQAVENEVRRVVAQDPRILLNTVTVAVQQNGLMLQLELSIAPFNQALTTNFFLNSTNGQITQV